MDASALPRRNLIHFVSANSWGGPEQYALDICRYFAAQGWRVRVVTRDTKDVDSRFREAGISLRHAPLRDYPDIFSALMLRNTLRRIPQGEGIVHVHSGYDALTALLARRIARRPDIRVVYTRHVARRADRGRLQEWVYTHVDRIIFVSEFARRRFLSAWPDGNPPILPDVMGVAYNSLYINEEDMEYEAEPDKGPKVAMFRGRIRPGKGLETLIDAMSLLKDVKLRLRIVGTGTPDYVDAIRRRAQMRGLTERIDWTRRAEHPLALIRSAHFGVFPSVEPEAFGLTNLEFMACGRPQISTLTGGQKEFLTPGEDCLESRPADAVSLADAMRRLALDPTMRQRLGSAALSHFSSHFSWHIFIHRLLQAYL